MQNNDISVLFIKRKFYFANFLRSVFWGIYFGLEERCGRCRLVINSRMDLSNHRAEPFFPPRVFFIPDTLAEDVAYRAEDLAIKCSFSRIKQAIWRVFRARHKDSIAAPYLCGIKIEKFSLPAFAKSSPAIMANFSRMPRHENY